MKLVRVVSGLAIVVLLLLKGVPVKLPFKVRDTVSPRSGTVKAFYCPHCGGDPAHPCPIRFLLREEETARIEIGGDLEAAFTTTLFETCCDCRIVLNEVVAGWADCDKLKLVEE